MWIQNDFLPGKLSLGRGKPADYRALARFHYRRKHPRTWDQVWTIHYHEPVFDRSRIIAIGVLSYPLPNSLCRRAALGIGGTQRSELRFANRHIRTISRVIVHPQFRSLGLSKLLIRCLCKHCKTRYVEALAMMGRAHPLFERAGMRRINPRSRDSPVYFFFDRKFPTNHSRRRFP
jgi:ABC-type ATPase with predicted acetyltransferase domain